LRPRCPSGPCEGAKATEAISWSQSAIPSPLWGEGQEEGRLCDTLTLTLSLKGEGMKAFEKDIDLKGARHDL
jgi:hypothetical protein